MTILALALLSAAAFAQDAAKIDWKKDYDAALQEAKKSGRYVVVHFSGPECPACKRMDETTYAQPAVIEQANKTFVNVAVYLDVPNPLAKQFGIEAIPTTFLLAPGGERVRNWVGYVGPDEYRKGLEDAVSAHGKIRDVEAKLKADPESFELNRDAAGLYEALGRARPAATALQKAASKASDGKTQGGLLTRALTQLYDVEIDEALNDEILALAARLEGIEGGAPLGFKAEALAARAQIAMNREKKDDAIKLFEELVERHPASEKAPLSLLWLADLYHHHQQNNAKAEKALQKLLEKYPKSDVADDARSMLEHLKAHK